MRVRLVRIGNSHGIRIPQELIKLYRLREGSELELDERREGILLRVIQGPRQKVSWEASYKEMTEEAAEDHEWSEWDVTAGDGLEG